jgi:hypothetical protein
MDVAYSEVIRSSLCRKGAACAAPDELFARCGGEDSAGDGSGLFPHLCGVGVGAGIPEFHCGVVDDAGKAGGWRGLAHQRALFFDCSGELWQCRSHAFSSLSSHSGLCGPLLGECH